MRLLLPFALLLVALPLGAMPFSLAAPAQDDVAWLAEELHVGVADLPATMPLKETSYTAAGPIAHVRDAPIGEVASLLRVAASAPAPNTDGIPAVAVPSVPSYAGAGFRGIDGTGVGWSGFALGQRAMPCIHVSSTATPLEVPASPLGPGGPLLLQVSAALPSGPNVVSRGGSASMGLAVLPSPSAGPTTVPAVRAESALLAGSSTELCYVSFTLRVSFASYRGDGVIDG